MFRVIKYVLLFLQELSSEAQLDQRVPKESRVPSGPRFVIFNEACERWPLNERATIFRKGPRVFLHFYFARFLIFIYLFSWNVGKRENADFSPLLLWTFIAARYGRGHSLLFR